MVALRAGETSAIDAVSAHGTSTQANDSTETAAVRTVFGAAADTVAISSTKSMTGHLLGAAGGIELVASALAVARGVLPLDAWALWQLAVLAKP